ncbi:uncharacterized protein N7506_002835 [Penicillium brevicompactum]|uniref:uncharacterized protein n=1 Tax=Penicillium brevicompactum TaxID=5074 RepID=UPI002541DCE7|nr:uncharacterized protein N7506_002835 [Penicillium brevicompactum]KAJ5343011.1 hypothetical protein N7506_002835 [Penicillium brevicompactum]
MPITVKELEETPLGNTLIGLTEKTLGEVFKSLLLAFSADSTASQATGAEKSSSRKTTVPRYALCGNCKEDFDVTANTDKSCFSEADQDSHLYEDLDDWMEADTEENREEWPECFIFLCCEENLGDNPHGCKVDFHRRPEPSNRFKRARVA